MAWGKGKQALEALWITKEELKKWAIGKGGLERIGPFTFQGLTFKYGFGRPGSTDDERYYFKASAKLPSGKWYSSRNTRTQKVRTCLLTVPHWRTVLP